MKQEINRAAAQKELDGITARVKQLQDIINVKRENIAEWLFTFKDACDDQGIDVKDFFEKCKGLEDDEIAYRQAKIFVKAANQEWEPDYDNSNEYKYEPRFDMRTKSGFGFSGTGYVCWGAGTHVGSHLC